MLVRMDGVFLISERSGFGVLWMSRRGVGWCSATSEKREQPGSGNI